MSRQPPPSGQQPYQPGNDAQYRQAPSQSAAHRRTHDLYYRDPDTGRFLTDQEAAYVEQLARQYPQQVQQAYAQNVPFSAVGLSVPSNLGDLGTQISSQQQSQQPQQPQQPQQFQQVPQQSQQPQQMAPEPQQPRAAGNQGPGGQRQQYQRPPQQRTVERPDGQISAGSEQALQTQSGGSEPVRAQATSEQPQQTASQQPEPTTERSQGGRPAEGVSIPIEEGEPGQATQAPLSEGGQRSQRPGYQQRRQHQHWHWSYNW